MDGDYPGPQLMVMGKASIWAEYLKAIASHKCYAARWHTFRQESDWDNAQHYFGMSQGLFNAYCLSV